MKFINVIFIQLLVFCSCFAQSADPNSYPPNPYDIRQKKNLIELVYNTSYFFDGTPTNWYGLIKVPSPKERHLPYFERKRIYVLPLDLGFKYTRNFSEEWSACLSTSVFYREYEIDSFDFPGQVYQRGYVNVGLNALYAPVQNHRSKLEFLGGLGYRIGAEQVFLHQPRSWEYISGYAVYNDIGLNAGAKASYRLFWNLVASVELSYTRYLLFLGEKSYTHFRYIPTPNNLNVYWGLGIQF